MIGQTHAQGVIGRGARVRRGLTVAELMVATFITALIGGAVLSVAVAVSNSSDDGDEISQNNRIARSGVGEIADQLRNSRLVVSGDGASIAMWKDDGDDPGVINADEVTVFCYDGTRQIITRTLVRFPVDLAPSTRLALNTPLLLSDISTVPRTLEAIGNTQYLQTQIIAENISGFKLRYDAAPPLCRSVGVTMTVGQSPTGVSLDTTATLRSNPADWVQDVSGVWVIMSPL